LASLDPSTAVTVTDTARVAGRPVYQLVLTPRSGSTLVGSVVLAVDSETGMPLGVTISAVGQADPAFSVTFSSIDFSAPDASLFTFAAPVGAKVTEKALSAADARAGSADTTTGAPKPTITGSGWSSIIELPAGALATGAMPAGAMPGGAAGAAGDGSAKLLDQLLTPVAGGKVLETSLVSVFLAADGRVFIGAVSAEQLQAAAAR
jgi:hypothetical protein